MIDRLFSRHSGAVSIVAVGGAALLVAGCFGGAPAPKLQSVAFGCVAGNVPQQEQAFVVPPGVTAVTIGLFGGQGGTGSRDGGQPAAVGGKGGSALASFAVTPGEVLSVDVGCRGGDAFDFTPGARGKGGAPNGFQGTAAGGAGGDGGLGGAGGAGGGASDVRRGGTLLIVAGGGGGGGGANKNSIIGGAGGGGGGLVGLEGLEAPGNNLDGGLGGTQTEGGAGDTEGPGDGQDGVAGAGGKGGGDLGNVGGGAGGGGGGLFGGGGGSGGANTGVSPGGGGGGSGFIAPGAVGPALAADQWTGDGAVVISFFA